MCVLVFSTTFIWNISHSNKNWARYDQKLVFTSSIRYSCPILVKLQFSREIFEKYSNIKFHENRIVEPNFSIQKDKHDEAKIWTDIRVFHWGLGAPHAPICLVKRNKPVYLYRNCNNKYFLFSNRNWYLHLNQLSAFSSLHATMLLSSSHMPVQTSG
jgi:hypothetical protein